MSWRRSLRYAVGVAGLGFALALYLLIGRHPTPKPSPAPKAPSDAAASQVESTVHIVQTDKGAVVGTLDAGLMKQYQNGRTHMQDVTLRFDRGDRQFTIHAGAGDTQNQAGSDLSAVPDEVHLNGGVHLTTSDGLVLDASDATYIDKTGLLTIPGAFRFTRDRLTGSAVGGSYDRERNVIWLNNQAAIDEKAGPDGRGALHATASAIGVARADHYVRLDGDVNLVRDGETMRANSAMMNLTPDNALVQSMTLSGAASVMPPADARTGSPPELHGDTIGLDLQADGRTFKHVTLAGGQPSMVLTGPDGRRSIAAQAIDAGLGADGTRLTGLDAQRSVAVVIDASGATPSRQIQAASLTAAGTDKDGLTAADFGGGVTLHETRPAGAHQAAIDRTTRAAAMALTLGGDLGTISRARFTGGFSMTDRDLSATAGQANFNEQTGDLALAPAGPGGLIEVRTARMHVTAPTRVDVNTESNDLHAVGTSALPVTTYLTPPNEQKASDRKTVAPALFNATTAINATAADLAYTDKTGAAVFTGAAVVFQDANYIRAATIALDNDTGNLTAGGGVQSVFDLDDPNRTPPAPGEAPVNRPNCPGDTATCVSAKTLAFTNDTRTAVYTSGAQMDQPGGQTMSAEVLTLELGQDGHSLNRVTAEGTPVEATFQGGSEGSGTRLVYLVGDDTFDMTGAPAVILQRKPDHTCQQAKGPLVTFLRANDQLKRAADQLSIPGAGKMGDVPCPAVKK